MQVLSRASLKYPDGRVQVLMLCQAEPKVLRWYLEGSTRRWDEVDYVSKDTAIAQLRVSVDGDPSLVGVDLTILPVGPTPCMRAAKRIAALIDRPDHAVSDHTVDAIARIVAEQTGIEALQDSVQTLVAYCFKCRPAFARALFPVTPAGAPRDLTFDGLLLAVVKAMELSLDQKFDNLIKILTEEVSQISVVRSMPGGVDPKRVQ